MARARWVLLLAGWLFLLATEAHAQRSANSSPLLNDLCGCMSRIDARSDDARLSMEVRGCLEDAVLLHPVEVRKVLANTKGSGSKAFQLGAAIGGALEQVCPSFAVLRTRLRAIAGRSTTGRPGT